MARLPRLVVFDCDGTLVDSQHSIVRSVQRAFERGALDPPAASEIRRRVGLSLLDFMRDLAPELDLQTAERITRHYREDFAQERQRSGPDPFFDGIEPLLRRCHDEGILLGVATGKSRRGLRELLDAHGIRDLFATLQTSDDAPSKPHPGMIENALEETGTEAGDARMVGDTVFDVEAARHAGVASAGVSWGYHDTESLRRAGSTVIVQSASELEAWILGGA